MIFRDGLIDFHTHTLHSDGALLPAEQVARARARGYAVLGLTDHADASNFAEVILAARETAAAFNHRRRAAVKIIPGVELTHVPPEHLADLAAACRAAGATLIIVHGETPVEPVERGTNAAALAADIDILAHPGLLTAAEAKLAARRGIALELTARGGHSLGNGLVAQLGQAAGAMLVVDSDTHAPADLLTRERACAVLRGAGLTDAAVRRAAADSAKLAARLLARWEREQ